MNRLRLLGRVEKKTEEDIVMRTWKTEVSETPKDRTTKTEVKQSYTKRYEGERSTERRSAILENVDNENFKNRENAEKEEGYIS